MSTSSVEEIHSDPLEAAVSVPNGMSEGSRYRDLPHRSSNESLKAHSTFAVKLSETGKAVVPIVDGLDRQPHLSLALAAEPKEKEAFLFVI